MKIKSLILFIIFSLFLISCESKDKWINPYDSKADQAEVDKICKQNNKECGIFSVNYKGVSFEMDCGECSDGYECRDNTCWDINECNNPTLNNCPVHSDCHNLDMESDRQPYECICKENYSGDDCVPDSREKECGDLPANAEWNSVSSITQTWNGTEWLPSNSGTFNETPSTSECRFKCKENYDWTGSACKADSRTANCTGLPANAEWNTASSIEQTWNGEEWTPSSEGTFNPSKSSTECHFKCKSNFEWNGSECVGKTQTANCTGLPENAVWNTVSEIEQTFNGSTWQPVSSGKYSEEASETECRFKCKENYDWSGSKCVAATQETDCTGKPENAVWNSAESITQTWNGSAWIPSATGSYNEESSSEECRFKCEPEYIWFSSQCIIPVSPCDPNPCGSIENSTGSCTISDTTYICECDANYNWSTSTKKCDPATQEADCQPKPDNSVWNDDGANGKFIQTWNGSTYTPESYTSTYNETAGICRFLCDSGCNWDGTHCLNPAAEECVAVGGNWNESKCTRTQNCSSKPANTDWNTASSITQTWNGSSWTPSTISSYNETASETECRFKCNSPLLWSGTSCLPECSASSKTPCYDSTSHLTWSEKASSTMSWDDAETHCTGLNSSNYGGYSNGWHLPNIDELRTLIRNCPGTVTGGSCGVTNTCLSSSCQNASCYSCDYNNTGKYSKFGETGWIWSSSFWIDGDDGFTGIYKGTWLVNFDNGRVEINDDDSYKASVRCVRSQTSAPEPTEDEECVNAGGTWNGSSCTKTANCSGKPTNTIWNDNGANGKFTQEWNGSDWSPASYSSSYSETAGVCRYRCESGYNWSGSACTNSGTTTFPECSKTSKTPCKDSSSGLTWSKKAENTMAWLTAYGYCNDYTEGGYSDWHLPTISELRTLLINANRVTSNCQVSETYNCLSSSCWSCSTCTEQGTPSTNGTDCDSWGTSYSNGRYSKFGETGGFWSSSFLSDSSFSRAWYVHFNYGVVRGCSDIESTLYVRCVR